jgi:hypothetical protein
MRRSIPRARLEGVELDGDLVGLPLVGELGLEPSLAAVGVVDEVADDGRRDP